MNSFWAMFRRVKATINTVSICLSKKNLNIYWCWHGLPTVYKYNFFYVTYWPINVDCIIAVLIQRGGVRGCISNYFSIGQWSYLKFKNWGGVKHLIVYLLLIVKQSHHKMVSCLQEWLEICKNIEITIQKCIFPLFVGHA